MRLPMLISLQLAFSCQLIAQHYDTQMIPYRKGAKWGYCTPSKKVVIEPKFTTASFFEGPLAAVRIDSYYCVINRTGTIVFKSTNFTSVVNEGRNFISSQGSLYYQMHGEDGKPVGPVYTNLTGFGRSGYCQFTERYSAVGLMNSDLKIVLPAKYTGIEFFSSKLLRVYDGKGMKFGLLSLTAGELTPCEYDKIYEPREGLCMVAKGKLYGFIDTTGKVVIPLAYGKVTPERVAEEERYNESTYQGFNYDGFYNGLAVVLKDGKAGYINHKNEVVIPFKFEKAFGFIDGFAWVKLDGKWGMINSRGAYALKPVYTGPAFLSAKELDLLDGFHGGLVAVTTDSLYSYVDTNGKVVVKTNFTRVEPFYEGMAAVYVGDNVGFIDRTGKMVIPAKYKWVEGTGQAYTQPFADGCGIATLPNDKLVIIDKRGKQITTEVFDGTYSIYFSKGIASGCTKDKTFVFDNKGKVLYIASKAGYTIVYTPELIYSYGDEAYVDIKKHIVYAD